MEHEFMNFELLKFCKMLETDSKLSTNQKQQQVQMNPILSLTTIKEEVSSKTH